MKKPVSRHDTLDLSWFGRHEAEGPDWARNLILSLEAVLPEAVPNTYKAMLAETESVFSWEDFDEFDRACRLDFVSWVGRPPVVSAGVSGLLEGDLKRRAMSPAIVHAIDVSLLLAVADEPPMHGRILDVVVRLASVVQAVYAVGTISRGMLIRPDGVYGDRESTPYNPKLDYGSVWRGVARHSVYLEWFGREYTELLPHDVAAEGTGTENGLLFDYGPHSGLRRRIPDGMLAPAATPDAAPIRPGFLVTRPTWS